jgi:hypothetical protein
VRFERISTWAIIIMFAYFNFSALAQDEPTQSPAPTKPSNSANAQNATNTAGSASTCKTQGQFSVTPAQARIAPGGTATFTASPDNGCTVPALQWNVDNGLGGLVVITPTNTPAGGGSVDVTLSRSRVLLTEAILADPSKNYIHITATTDTSESAQVAVARAVISLQPPGNIVIPIIGFEQAGASAAQSTQKFFFNLFISRPLPFGDDDVLKDGVNLGSRYRWFGNVRIASYPQQITSGVGEFATGFAGEVAKLKVNQLAQSGEFNMGLERRLKAAQWGLYGIGDTDVTEHSEISVIAGFGAISPLNPVEALQIFATPPVGSPQRAGFLNSFPASASSTYTGFVTPDRGRFYWEYGAGFRLSTLYFDKSNVLGTITPAMLTYTLGQNQVVTGGISSGVVQRIEGFFPLPLGQRFSSKVTTVYLFGRVDMRLARPKQIAPFILQPAPAGVNGFDSDVNIVTVRSNRDLYTIGVGVDAVKLIRSISLQNKNTTKSSASTSPPGS